MKTYWHALTLTLCCFLLLLSKHQTVYSHPTADDELTRELLHWLGKNGAVISNKIEIRHVIPGDSTSIRGVFATDTIREGELVCSIPWDLVIMPENIDKDNSTCGTIKALIKALRAENKTPYAKYLLAQPRHFLPGFWSKEGRELLKAMTGENLPPFDVEDVLTEDWADDCRGDLIDPTQLHAVMLVDSRADFQILVPFYDMMNHRNGKWYNVNHRAQDYADILKQPKFEIVASKDIKPGEELYNSYDQCNTCQEVKDSFGTPEMLKHFGFVEMMPQRWLFVEPRIKFDIDWKGQDESSGELEVEFYVPPSKWGMDFFWKELKRLELFEQQSKIENTSIPKSEWDTIWTYHSALTIAMTQVLNSTVELSDEVWNMGRYWWTPDGFVDEDEEYGWVKDEEDGEDDLEENDKGGEL